MTYSTLASQVDLGGRFPPARSIPNLPNETTRSNVETTDSYALARSTSQPAETWSRDLIVDSSITESHLADNSETLAKSLKVVGMSIATQTETNKIDLPAIEKFIVQNPRLVLNILGIIEPTYHIECELQPQTLLSIPEADGSSPEATSPPDNQKRFAFGITNPLSPSATAWNSSHNSNNKNVVTHCRSTDPLLPTSSDDCLLQSTENINGMHTTVVLPVAPPPPPPSNINEPTISSFNITREGSIKSQATRITSTAAECSRSNSATSLSSNSSLSTPPTSITESMQRIHPIPSISGHKRKSNSRKERLSSSSSCCSSNSSRKSLSATFSEKMLPAVEYMKDDDEMVNYDELNEKCALLCNDVRKNSISRTSIVDLQKRNHLMPRPPFTHRFSAGDADKLEKGIKNLPSTRSLKDS